MPDTDQIINSEAFRAINFLIDEKIKDMEWLVSCIKSRFEAACNPKYEQTVSTRTYEEGGHEVSFGLSLTSLDDVADSIRLLMEDKRAIDELQRYKLRLLNDYDFTHGDDETQRAVFGGQNQNA